MPSLFPTIAEILGDRSRVGLPETVDLQGWNSDHPIFDQLIEQVQPKVIIEVGTWKGRSCAHFTQSTECLKTEIYCVDTWLGGIDHFLSDKPQDDVRRDVFGSPRLYHQFLRNFADSPAAGRIRPIQQTSVNAARALAHRGLYADLIYIDASHEYEDVYADLCAYVPLLAPNGRIFGDDYAFPGVQVAVHRYAIEHGRRVHLIDNNFWVLL